MPIRIWSSLPIPPATICRSRCAASGSLANFCSSARAPNSPARIWSFSPTSARAPSAWKCWCAIFSLIPRREESKSPWNRSIQTLSIRLRSSVSRQPSHKTGGWEIHCDPLPSIRIQATQLQQLFQNLIGNALKYHRPGVPPVVNTAAHKKNGDWIFSVTDNGIGIEPQFKEKIFGLFKRLHTGDEYSGTGIGLAICHRIVERHSGRIWVESEPGQGSTFCFSLPA